MDEEIPVQSGNKKVIIVAVVAFLFLAIGGYSLLSGKSVNNKLSLTDGTGVASVNGVIIAKTAFDTQLASLITSYKSQNIDTENADNLAKIKAQALDNLINSEIINQEIVAEGIKATDEEVEARYQVILKQVGGAEALKAELTKNNLTEDQLRADIAKQLAADAYVIKHVDLKTITVSQAEIEQFYAEYTKAQKDPKSVPPLKELSEQIKQQITNNKQQAMVQDFVNTLRTKAKVETANQ